MKKNNIVMEDDIPGYIVKDGEMLFFYYIFIPGLVVHIRKIFAKPFFPPPLICSPTVWEYPTPS